MKRSLLAVALFLVACTQATPTGTPAPPTATRPPTVAPPTATLALPTATPVPIAAALEACGAPSPVSLVEAPVPTTPTPALTPASATPTPAASPTPRPPTPTPRPAPQVDRVGFPEGYQENFRQFYVFDRLDAKSVSYICANETAASVKPGEPFPYGSILVFESWRVKEDPSGNPIKDASGHLIRERLNAIFVMRKEPGFGEAYQNLRTGEWEYVAYRPDKTHQTPPQGSAGCAACHTAAGPDRDWVFRAELFSTKDRYAQSPLPGQNEVSMSRMAFFPSALSVKVGATVKWINSPVDKIPHTATSSDNAFDSGVLQPGGSFTYTFTSPGTFQYFCALHPEQMRARIQVTN